MKPVPSTLIAELRRIQEIYDAGLLAGGDAVAVNRALWDTVGMLGRAYPSTKKVTGAAIAFNDVPRQHDYDTEPTEQSQLLAGQAMAVCRTIISMVDSGEIKKGHPGATRIVESLMWLVETGELPDFDICRDTGGWNTPVEQPHRDPEMEARTRRLNYGYGFDD